MTTKALLQDCREQLFELGRNAGMAYERGVNTEIDAAYAKAEAIHLRLDAALSAPDQAVAWLVYTPGHEEGFEYVVFANELEAESYAIGSEFEREQPLYLAPPATQAGALLKELVAVKDLGNKINALDGFTEEKFNERAKLIDEHERRYDAIWKAARQYVAGQAVPSNERMAKLLAGVSPSLLVSVCKGELHSAWMEASEARAAGFAAVRNGVLVAVAYVRRKGPNWLANELNEIAIETDAELSVRLRALQPGEADHG